MHQDGVLAHIANTDLDIPVCQVVLAVQYRSVALGMAHDEDLGGHSAVEHMAKLLCCVMWPNINMDTKSYIRQCLQCQHPKVKVGKAF